MCILVLDSLQIISSKLDYEELYTPKTLKQKSGIDMLSIECVTNARLNCNTTYDHADYLYSNLEVL